MNVSHCFPCSWSTVNDELAEESPAFFCENCFKALHYTKDGKKVTSFEAYPYFDELTTLLESGYYHKSTPTVPPPASSS